MPASTSHQLVALSPGCADGESIEGIGDRPVVPLGTGEPFAREVAEAA